MDENYLDNLLNEISLDKEIDHNVEEELDSQLQNEREKHQEAASLSRDDMFNIDLEQDAGSSNLDGDFYFSEEQMNELDNLDDLADLDIGDLDFSDIDFDDLDVTKLDEIPNDQDLDSLLKEFDGDFEIEDHFDQEEQSEDAEESQEEAERMHSSAQKRDMTSDETFDADQFLDSLLNDEEMELAKESPVEELKPTEELTGLEELMSSEEEPVQTDVARIQSEEETTQTDSQKAETETDESVEEAVQSELLEFAMEDTQEKEPERMSESEAADDLDDLFSLLDLEENGGNLEDGVQSPTEMPGDMAGGQDENLDALAFLDDLEELPEEKPVKKKSFMTLLFGEPDEEDELTPEELEAAEQKKAAKKAKKEAAKQAKEEKKAASKAEKEFKSNEKKKAQEEKKKIKAVKRAKQKEEAAKNAEPEKPLNRPAVIFIFSLFLGGTFLFYLATNNFNYTLAIQKATDYFDNQKYHKAYDEIKGVEVKEKDQELKDRIYTVMYVERLYESYQNNLELNRQKKALDSLLRGVDKYYEYYEEAQQLGIVEDLDYSFAQIQTALQDNYGITIEQAVAMNQLDSYEYVQTVDQYVQDGKW